MVVLVILGLPIVFRMSTFVIMPPTSTLAALWDLLIGPKIEGLHQLSQPPFHFIRPQDNCMQSAEMCFAMT